MAGDPATGLPATGAQSGSLSLGEALRGPPRFQAVTAWGPASVLLALAVMAALIIAVQVLTVKIAAHVLGAEAFNKQIVEAGLESPLMLLSAVLTQVPLTVMVWIAAGRRGLRAETLQLAKPPLSWAGCVAAGVALVAIQATLLTAFHLISPGYDLAHETRSFVSGLRSPLWWGTLLSVGVLAPICEELTVRGFLLTSLANSKLAFWAAALVSNLLWTSLHFQYSLWGMAAVFAGGVFLTWVVWRTASMRAAIVAHTIGNLSILAYLAAFAP